MIQAYLIEFESKTTCVVRYLCGAHAKEVLRLKWMKRLEVKSFIEIHGDIYDKKCHLCKRRK